MEVVLLKKVDKLGKAGDLVVVAPGFANNHLFPKGLAELATAGNKKQLATMLKQLAKQDMQRKTEALAISEKLKQVTLELKVKASDTGKIFGAVTSAQISEALKAYALEITDEQIKIPELIKATGNHKVTITLDPEVVVELTCSIVAA